MNISHPDFKSHRLEIQLSVQVILCFGLMDLTDFCRSCRIAAHCVIIDVTWPALIKNYYDYTKLLFHQKKRRKLCSH